MPAWAHLFNSFRARILASGILALVLGSALIILIDGARTNVEHQLALQLSDRALAADKIIHLRADELAGVAERLAADSGFKNAISTGDKSSLVSSMAHHGASIGADAVLLFDANGRLIAGTSDTAGIGMDAGLQAIIAGQSNNESVQFYRLINAHTYQIALAPVLGSDLIGWTAVAFRLDDRSAVDLARWLGAQISYLSIGSDPSASVASSLPSTDRTYLAGLDTRSPQDTPFSIQAGDTQILTWISSISLSNGRLLLVLQHSMSEALEPYKALQRAILALGATIVLAACLLVIGAARKGPEPRSTPVEPGEPWQAGDHSSYEPSQLAGALDAMRMLQTNREAAIRRLSLHDSLTQLPTLTAITETLQELLPRARAMGQPVTVCLIEVQQLQDTISSLGHAAGDELLWEVARRLTDSHINERVARVATDRFLVVREGKDANQAQRLAAGIVEQLTIPLDYSGACLQIACRIGIAVFPEDGALPSELLQRAELALYRAKQTGTLVSTCMPGDTESHRRCVEMLADLSQAIGTEQLQLYYQPKVAASDGRVVGCEALLGWNHPIKGLIATDDFMLHAEHTGMISRLTRWVLSSALKQLRRWQDAGISLDLSINLTAADLADPGLVHTFSELVRQTGADPRCIVLEINETVATQQLPTALRTAEALRILGVRLAIDDFGTAYGASGHFRRLSVDELKIDRTLIADLEAQPAQDLIVRSAINLAHGLGLRVSAEGVEQAVSFDALTRLGCDSIQGCFVAKAMSASEFTSWLAMRVCNQVQRSADQHGQQRQVGQA